MFETTNHYWLVHQKSDNKQETLVSSLKIQTSMRNKKPSESVGKCGVCLMKLAVFFGLNFHLSQVSCNYSGEINTPEQINRQELGYDHYRCVGKPYLIGCRYSEQI